MGIINPNRISPRKLEEVILNGTEHTFRSLCLAFKATDQQKMQIDRTIQKLRRNGLIKFRKDGHDFVWSSVRLPEGA